MVIENIDSRRSRHESVIVTNKLCKVYPTGTRAVDNINLDIKRDDFVSIIGSSGAGKSSLLRIFNRLVKPTSGSISLFGEDISSVSGYKKTQVRQKVGMIFQQFHLVRRLTVLQNVLVGRLRFNSSLFTKTRSLCKIFNIEDKEIAFECLKQVGIEHLAFQRADTLSGGQQQRVAIARTLAQEPEVFLADEPIASLDPHSAEVVMEILLKIHETQNIPVLVNIHHIDFARRYGKRILGMKQGALVFDGNSLNLTEDEVTNIYGAKINEASGEVFMPIAQCA